MRQSVEYIQRVQSVRHIKRPILVIHHLLKGVIQNLTVFVECWILSKQNINVLNFEILRSLGGYICFLSLLLRLVPPREITFCGDLPLSWVDFDLSNKSSTILTRRCKDANAARVCMAYNFQPAFQEQISGENCHCILFYSAFTQYCYPDHF